MTPDQRAVVDVVRREFGDPLQTRFAETWGPRVVVEAQLAATTVFLKATGDADVRAEEAAIGLARAAGVPAPEIVKSGADSGIPGGYWMAMTKATGVNWPIDEPANTDRTLRDISSTFARLYDTSADGFGPLSSDGVGTYGSWSDWLHESLEEYLQVLVEAGLTTTDFGSRARSVFVEATPSIERGSLVHGDLGPGETFVDPGDGAVTCLVDWGAALIGDPVYELARFVAGGPADDPRPAAFLPPLIEHYIADTGIDKARLTETLPLYQAHNAIWNAVWSHREGVPWVPALLAKAEALLS